MTAEIEVLDIVITEFPHLHRRISELYYESSSFLELCEDFVLCLNSIKKHEQLKNRSKEKELNDLRTVLTELKEELLSRILNP